MYRYIVWPNLTGLQPTVALQRMDEDTPFDFVSPSHARDLAKRLVAAAEKAEKEHWSVGER